MTYFITGATGLVGSLLIKRLLADEPDCRIIAHIRNIEKARDMLGEHENLSYVIGDIREQIVLPESLKDIESIDYVIHCAAVTTSKTMIEQPELTLKIATEGTKSVLDFAREYDAKSMVYLSSMEVYGQTALEQNPITEDKMGTLDLDNPRSCYPMSKRLCEEMCVEYFEKYGLPVKIARLAQITGPGIPKTDNRIAMQFAKAARDGNDVELHTEGKSISNFCYTEDALNGILTILHKGVNGEAYNVCNDKESRSIAEIGKLVVEKVAAQRGKNIKLVFNIPETNIHGYAPDTVMRLNSDKLRALGWEATVSMEEAYNKLVDYLEV